MTIRQATDKDAPIFSEIMQSLAHYYFPDVTSQMSLPDWLSQSMQVEAFEERIHSSDYVHWAFVTESCKEKDLRENKVVGYIALKKDMSTGQFSHLYHLFVRETYQKQGIAKALWYNALQETQAKTISLRSSLYAVPVYESFGFHKTGNVKYKDGLAFQPMMLEII